jgi:hypothetical protein
MRTMFPMGLSDDNNVCTTSFRPGALLMTRSGLKDRSSLKTCSNIFITKNLKHAFGLLTCPQNSKNPGTALRNEGHQQVNDGDEHENSVHNVPAGRKVRFSAVEHASGYHLQE